MAFVRLVLVRAGSGSGLDFRDMMFCGRLEGLLYLRRVFIWVRGLSCLYGLLFALYGVLCACCPSCVTFGIVGGCLSSGVFLGVVRGSDPKSIIFSGSLPDWEIGRKSPCCLIGSIFPTNVY